MVTMSDVARAAGVSPMTVSNVINGRPNVSEATRERVRQVIRELGYQVNLTARHLRAGRTDSIALIAPNFNGYFGELGDGIARLLQRSGRHLVMESTLARLDAELEAFSMARLRMHDGAFISVSGLSAEQVARLQSPVPVVLLGERQMPGELDHLQLDNVGGGRLATSHLVERGARRIAVLGGSLDPERDMPFTRQEGWRRALEDAGLEAGPELVLELEQYSPDEAAGALTGLLQSDDSIDGVFAVTDTVALGALAALRAAGRSVPDEVQVCGFDNLEAAEFSHPGGLSTVGPEPGELPRIALELLERRIADGDAEPRHLVVPLRLYPRSSTR